MTIHTNVILESSSTFYMQSADSNWTTAANGPADSAPSGGTSQPVRTGANDGSVLHIEAAYSFPTSTLIGTYGAALEITAASFKYEILSHTAQAINGIVSYVNNFSALQLSDWVPISKAGLTTAWTDSFFTSATGIRTVAYSAGGLSSVDSRASGGNDCGIILLSGWLNNAAPPTNDAQIFIANQSHATAFAPSLIMTIDDHKAPGNPGIVGAAF